MCIDQIADIKLGYLYQKNIAVSQSLTNLPIDFFPQIGYNMTNLEFNSRLVVFCLVKYELY